MLIMVFLILKKKTSEIFKMNDSVLQVTTNITKVKVKFTLQQAMKAQRGE